MLAAAVMDFDGVIADSEALHLKCFNSVLSKFSATITKREYFDRYLGLNDRDCFELLVREGRLSLDPARIPELVAEKNELFNRLAAVEGTIIPGVQEFVEMLRNNRVPMAVCSGALKPEIELILEGSPLRGLFAAIVSAEEVSRGKPDPQGFLLAIEKLSALTGKSISPAKTIAVEDSQWGIDAAAAAGMHVIAVTNSYEAGRLKNADLIVDRLDELDMKKLRLLCR